MRLAAAVSALCLAATPSFAQAIADSEFLVHRTNADGTVEITETAIVPLDPSGVCFEWRLKIDEEQDEMLQITEVFKLPSPPKEWTGIEGNEFSATTISADRRTATTAMYMVTQDRWFGHQWCVGEGDPDGDYEIEVIAGSNTLHQFFFTLMGE